MALAWCSARSSTTSRAPTRWPRSCGRTCSPAAREAMGAARGLLSRNPAPLGREPRGLPRGQRAAHCHMLAESLARSPECAREGRPPGADDACRGEGLQTERMYWRAGVDPNTRERREALVLREKAVNAGRRDGGKTNATAAAGRRASRRASRQRSSPAEPGRFRGATLQSGSFRLAGRPPGAERRSRTSLSAQK